MLSQNVNRITLIYVKDGRRYKRNRTGHHLTISLGEAMAACAVSPVVVPAAQALLWNKRRR